MKKVAFFFGAGAEVDYGFPTGVEFALNIFRVSPDEAKQQFRRDLEDLDPTTLYASDWLPDDYRGKRLYAFGKTEYGQIIASSLEYRRDNIVEYLESFDDSAARVARAF